MYLTYNGYYVIHGVIGLYTAGYNNREMIFLRGYGSLSRRATKKMGEMLRDRGSTLTSILDVRTD